MITKRNRRHRILIAVLATAVLTGAIVHGVCRGTAAAGTPTNDVRLADPTWRDAAAAVAKRAQQLPPRRRARNVILFIGDGMGVSTVTAMRIYDGQQKGASGEENFLPFERFPFSALVKTYNANAQVPDSAGTASAMMTGMKVNIGVLNVAASHPSGQCAGSRKAWLATIAEELEDAGFATGIVSTARLTHATPAAVYAHSPSRAGEADVDLTPQARKNGCVDIARQFVEFPHGDGIDVAMGGGRANFLPRGRGAGRRGDGRDLVAEWQHRHPDGRVVRTGHELAAVDPAEAGHLLGLFTPSHMAFDTDRRAGGLDQPSLAEMTQAAIRLLQARNAKGAKGYFLMVEGGRIDHAHHMGNAFRALSDGHAFARAVEQARTMTDENETLILVTADHSHVFVIAGYPPRGNPILGLVHRIAPDGRPSPELRRGRDGKPYTTLGYWNGPGAHPGKPRPALDDQTVLAPDYRQQAAVPLDSETHGGEDVPLYASGPGAVLARGVIEQNEIYHMVRRALGLSPADDRQGDDRATRER